MGEPEMGRVEGGPRDELGGGPVGPISEQREAGAGAGESDLVPAPGLEGELEPTGSPRPSPDFAMTR
jgi:hypothetical protein